MKNNELVGTAGNKPQHEKESRNLSDYFSYAHGKLSLVRPLSVLENTRYLSQHCSPT